MAAQAMKAGSKVGPYELASPLGAGGMGEVWKARDTRLDRVVAIKFSQAQFTERFGREARAIAALNHPNIAQIYDVGENYIVMEFVDGEPVRAPGNTRKLLDIAVLMKTTEIDMINAWADVQKAAEAIDKKTFQRPLPPSSSVVPY